MLAIHTRLRCIICLHCQANEPALKKQKTDASTDSESAAGTNAAALGNTTTFKDAEDEAKYAKYHQLASFDEGTNGPSSTFIYDFECVGFCAKARPQLLICCLSFACMRCLFCSFACMRCLFCSFSRLFSLSCPPPPPPPVPPGNAPCPPLSLVCVCWH